ncbi:MAG: hypothetical protein JXR07_20020 [Reichenbachiella sp.]
MKNKFIAFVLALLTFCYVLDAKQAVPLQDEVSIAVDSDVEIVKIDQVVISHDFDVGIQHQESQFNATSVETLNPEKFRLCIIHDSGRRKSHINNHRTASTISQSKQRVKQFIGAGDSLDSNSITTKSGINWKTTNLFS